MKSPAVRFYASDFLSGTDHMSSAEVGFYIRLICYSWLSGGLPDNPKSLARLGRWDEGGEAPQVVLAKFSKGEDGLLRNKRLEEERAKQEAYQQRQTNAAVSRWDKEKKKVEPSVPEQQKSNNGAWHPTPEQVRLAAIMRRKPETPWTAEQLKAWRAITPVDEVDLQKLERYYRYRGAGEKEMWKKTNFDRFIRDITVQIEKARAWREPSSV